jgi:hypothetical protein
MLQSYTIRDTASHFQGLSDHDAKLFSSYQNAQWSPTRRCVQREPEKLTLSMDTTLLLNNILHFDSYMLQDLRSVRRLNTEVR